MSNPLSKLINKLFTDPVEQVGVALPSAALVAVFFSYREQIHPALLHLPDPFSASTAGALLFLLLTLAVSLIIKRLSHDLLNSAYDHLYRDRKRLKSDSWYRRAQTLALSTNDPLLSKYHEALDRLRDNDNPVVSKVEALQIQSKLARSLTLILLIFSLVLFIEKLILLALVCGSVSGLMLSSFCKERWAASELVYQALYETYYRQERRHPIWTSPMIHIKKPVPQSRATESVD
ncbi:hypothetical protein [Methylomonas albis]|uniref:SMODS and SLOG-associating 2TM effector domain-containing protein n=1 Tax=Methylomonas albis TaxID=1854563 RepID=A0ABR9D143_9GAMM|nr:hypothetical protein [Methylomonas albis]MBD9356851.1 hypothetical protein [Methylomonas albis]CAD6880021.1 hypothetical protein [Methylomonas albis]